MLTKEDAIKDLKQIPGVGVSIANDLWNIGIRSVADLKQKKNLSNSTNNPITLPV